MNSTESWNPALNAFCDIKHEFESQFSKAKLWNYRAPKTCIEYWVESLNDPYYTQMMAPLSFTEYKNFLLIRYKNLFDMYDVKDGKELWDAYGGLYMECRSVVINTKREELVLTPFRKFRNLNECGTTSENRIAKLIETATTIEFANKLDGSMQSARWYENHLMMSGSRALDPKKSYRLAGGYEMIQNAPNYMEMIKAQPGYTFIFERIAADDPHIVAYSENDHGMYLVGMRSVTTGQELSYETIKAIASEYGVKTPETFDTTFSDVISNLNKTTCDEAEGFVLNIDGFKVKIKYDDFVTNHKLISALSSPKIIIKSISDDTFDDLVSKIPESHAPIVKSLAKDVYAFKEKRENEICQWTNELQKQNLPSTKDAMIWITNNVPKITQALVRNAYLEKPVNVLKPGNAYIKMDFIEDYLQKRNFYA